MKKVIPKLSPWSWLWLFLCAVLSLGQLQKISVTENIAFYIHDIVVLSWVVSAFFLHRKDILEGVKKLPKWAKFGIVWTVLSLVANLLRFASWQLTPWLYISRLVAYSFLLIDLYSLIKAKKISNTVVFIGLILCMGLIAWFGLLQYIFLPDTRELLYLGWDDHYYRVISTLLDPAFTGLILVAGWWLALLAWPFKKFSLLRSIFLIAVTIALLLTYSRSSYLALTAGAAVCISYLIHKRDLLAASKIFGIVVMLGISVWFLPRPAGEGVRLERQSTILARQQNMLESLASFSTKTWLVGDGMFAQDASGEQTAPYVDHSRIPDNWIIWILKSSGLGGLSSLLIGIIWLFKKAWRKACISQDALAALPLLVGVFIHGLFNASVPYPWTVIVIGSSVVFLLSKRER